MNNKGNTLISILLLLLGAAFVWLYENPQLTTGIVFVCGLTFALPSFILLLMAFFTGGNGERSTAYRAVQIICGIGGLCLGLAIVFLPELFRALLVYPFAALLIVGGAFQVLLLSHAKRPVDYPAWCYIVPIVVLVAGVVLLAVPALHEDANERWMVLITGICAILYGLNGVAGAVLSARLPRRPGFEKPAKGSASPEVGSGAGDGSAELSDGLNAEPAADVERKQVADTVESNH